MSISAAKQCTFASKTFTHITNYSVKTGGEVVKKLEDLSRYNTIYTGGAIEDQVTITTTDLDVSSLLKIGDQGTLVLTVIVGGIGSTAQTTRTFTLSNCYVSAIGDISHSNSDFAHAEQQITFEICKSASATDDPTAAWSAAQ